MEGPGSSNWKKFTRLKPGKKRFGKSAKQFEKATIRHAHKFIVSRYENIKSVKRYALGWLAAVGLLIGLGGLQFAALNNSYTTSASSDGGVYAEGVIGQLDVINPLFATTQSERSASRLVYSGLLGYDEGGQLKNDLAESWRVERDGLRYVVEMKPDATWHDGRPITADDVVFTTQLMANPVTRAQQGQSWSGINVEKLSDRTVSFDLPRAFAAFPFAMTFGVLPKHVFDAVPPENLRESSLNREPLGSGPFVFSRLQIIDPDMDRTVVYFTRNENYIHDEPRIERFQLHTFIDSEALTNAFINREVNAAAGMSAADMKLAVDSRSNAFVHDSGIDGGVYGFFNTDSAVLKDKKVRQALIHGFDFEKLKSDLDGYALPLDGPLLSDQVPNSPSQRQAQPYDIERANKLLDEAGWKKNNNGTREKDNRPLTIRLVGIDAGDYPTSIANLQSAWEELGITIEPQLVEPGSAQQNVIVPRAFDVLVYELEIGADPDVFAFWHNSQAGPRGLNLSNYRSDEASEALESAQLRFEDELRTPKYEAFVDTWVGDAPAVALYQPQVGYIVSQDVRSLSSGNSLPTRIERYANIHHWTITNGEVYRSQ